jgi:protein O-GlcNAc transferase
MTQLIQTAMTFHGQGRLAEAERAYSSVLAQDPDQFDALHLLGVLKLQQGNAAAAHAMISRALKLRPESTDALCNLSAALLALNRDAEALAACERILASDPADLEALCNRGNALFGLKRYQEAIATYDKVLAVKPEHVNTLFNHANALAALDRYDDALPSYDKVVALMPAHWSAFNNRGGALMKLNRTDQALSSYDQALALRQDDPKLIRNHANALAKLARFDDALASFDRALAFEAEPAETLMVRAMTLRALGRNGDAAECYDRILRLLPDDIEALLGRGDVLFNLGRVADALADYDRALQLHPDRVEALGKRGMALLHLDRVPEAIAAFKRALAFKPDDTDAFGGLAAVALDVCDWTQVEELSREMVVHVVERKSPIRPFAVLGYREDPALLLQCSRNFVASQIPDSPLPLHRGATFRHDRIRVAYLSADFRAHVMSYQLAELFERHDRSRFEVLGVSFARDDDSEIRARVVRSFDQFYDVSSKGDREVAKLLSDLEVDIAVDLMGHTIYARPRIFAYRPAPIQVNYLGYAGTMGADFIDYIIGDPLVLPFDQQPVYVEKIVQLPETFFVNDSSRMISTETPSRSASGLPERGFVFCCFNNSMKIRPQMFDIWMRLLTSVEGSVLWLSPKQSITKDNLRREAASRGVDPDRLIFAQRVPRNEDHLARQRLADLFLDTLPYNAHSTASDALWAGLPVVTCLGKTFAGRVAGSLLNAVGLPELITLSPEDYEALALRLATDPAALSEIKSKLERNRLRFPLYDTDRFRQHIEKAYTTMWETWQGGGKPASFEVAAT